LKRVLFDASCWVAASGSPSGGSSLILQLGLAGKLRIVSSPRILEEAERNVGQKLGAEALARLYALLADVDPEIVDECSEEELEAWNTLVHEKDRHILAAAFKAQVETLVSLDRRHILTDQVRAGFPIAVCDTKEFLNTFAAEQEESGPIGQSGSAE